MYQHILVPVDGSPTSDGGLDEAIKLAHLTGGRLRLLHVVDEMPFVMNAEGYGALSSDVRQIFKERAKTILAKAKAKVEQAGLAVDTVLFETFGARLVEHVVEQTRHWEADLIVLGTHGRRGVGRVLMGSDAEQVVRASSVPVLLVRAKETVAAVLAADNAISAPARTGVAA